MDRRTFTALALAFGVMLLGATLFCNQIAALASDKGVIRVLNDTDELVYYTVYWIDHPYGVWMDPHSGALRSDYAIAGGELRPNCQHDIKWAKGHKFRVKFSWKDSWSGSKPSIKYDFVFDHEYSLAKVTPGAVVLEE